MSGKAKAADALREASWANIVHRDCLSLIGQGERRGGDYSLLQCASLLEAQLPAGAPPAAWSHTAQAVASEPSVSRRARKAELLKCGAKLLSSSKSNGKIIQTK